jgi:OOP family OmpA-OmpF porin
MKYSKLLHSALLIGASMLCFVSYSQARVDASGYVEDSWGNIIRNGSGDCVHSDKWKPEMANIVGCDGVALDAKVETVRGESSGILAEIVVPSTAMFAFDSADLTAEGKEFTTTWQKRVWT